MIDRTKLFPVGVIIVFFAAIQLFGQAPDRKSVDAAFATAFKEFQADQPPVGFSVGVYKDGHIYKYNYGVVDKLSGKRTTDKTLYEIASITKTFAGTLLALAVIEKRVNLDDDIRKYLDGSYPNLEFDGQPIRLFHLLNHRSGLPNWLPDSPGTVPGSDKPAEWTDARLAEVLKDYTRADFYRDLHDVKINAVPGKYASYSNAGAQLLGYILERVYGVSFEELLRTKIFRPLKMHDTSITLSSSQRRLLANGYDTSGSPMPYTPDKVQAAGAIKTSVDDMLKYAIWHLKEEDAAARLTHKPTWSSADSNYAAGLNWQMLHSDDGRRLIWQTGNLAGFSGLCAIYPEQKMAIVILTNKQRARLTATASRLSQLIDPKAVPFP